MDIVEGKGLNSVPIQINPPSRTETESEPESESEPEYETLEPLVGQNFLDMTLEYNSIPAKFGKFVSYH